MSEKKEMFTVDKGLVNGVRRKFDNQTKNKYIYKKYSSTIEQLGKINLDEKDKNSMDNILKLLSSSDDFFKNSKYMEDIETILNKYKAEKTDVTKKTGLDLDGEKQKISNDSYFDYVVGDKKTDEGTLDYTSSNISESEKDRISEILDIDFNGEYTIKDLKHKISNLKESIKSGKIGEFLTDEQREIFSEKIENGLLEYNEQHEISLAIIEKYFDDMTSSIIVNNGKAYIEFENDGVIHRAEFSSKEEALKRIKAMKERSEIELQNFSRTLLEGFGNFTIKTLGFVLGKTFIPTVGKTYELVWEGEKVLFSYTVDSWKDIAGNWSDYDNLEFEEFFHAFASSILFLSSVSILVGSHTAVATSLKRRLYNDWIRGRDQNNSKYTYEDYYLAGKYDVSSANVGTSEQQEFNDFKQRQKIIELLKLKRDSFPIGSKEYIKYNKIFEKLNKYRLNKTVTFDFLVDKYIINDNSSTGKIVSTLNSIFYREGFYLFWPKTVNPFKLLTPKGWSGVRQIKSEGLIDTGTRKLTEDSEDIMNKMQEFYGKSVKIEIPDNSYLFKISFTDGTEVRLDDLYRRDYYVGIVNYIKDLPYVNDKTKEKRIASIRKYYETIILNPKSIDNIRVDLYRLANGYISNEDAIIKINSRITEIEKLSGGKIFNSKSYSKLHFFKQFGGEIAKLNYLKSMILNGKLVLTDKELQDLIENPSFKIKENFSERIKINEIKDEFERKSNSTNPNLTSGILEKGKEISEEIGEITRKYGETLEKIKSHDEFKKYFNYIDFIVDSKTEKNLKQNIENFINNFLSGKSLVTNEAGFLQEIKNISSNGSNIDFDLYKNLVGIGDNPDIYLRTNFKEQIEGYKISKILELVKSQAKDDDYKVISEIDNEITKLIEYIKKHKVTPGQLQYIINEFTSGKILFGVEDKLLGNNYLTVKNHLLDPSIKPNFEIEKSFSSLDKSNQEKFAHITKTYELNLPENIKNILNADNEHIEKLNDFIEELNNNNSDKSGIKFDFDMYVKSNLKNNSNENIENLIKQFEEKYKKLSQTDDKSTNSRNSRNNNIDNINNNSKEALNESINPSKTNNIDTNSEQQKSINSLKHKHREILDFLDRLEIELRLKGKATSSIDTLRKSYNNADTLKKLDLEDTKSNLELAYDTKVRDISELMIFLDFQQKYFKNISSRKIDFEKTSFDNLKTSDIIKGIKDGHIKFKL
ncbi:hypothetical protein DLH72_02475 [Candidatus Gracilibacteria bacterium]|nr:MAG: hypothetical protein DLH72_02475 [Candidatus Gracilibacteria bacterium]